MYIHYLHTYEKNIYINDDVNVHKHHVTDRIEVIDIKTNNLFKEKIQ